MMKAGAFVTGGFMGMFAVGVMTAEKPSDQYSKAMKDIDAAMQSLNKAIQAEDFDTVSKNAASMVDAFPVVEKYWAGKAQDAATLVQKAEKVAADLGVAAGLKSGEGVAYSAKELTDICMQCHTAHRNRLPDGSFEIK